jgi:hypothetical protein
MTFHFSSTHDVLCDQKAGQELVRVVIRFLTAVCSITALLGCSATPKTEVVEEQEFQELMPFIRDGITERQEILNRLGEPESVYEDERIVVYWLEEYIGGHFRPIPRRDLPRDEQAAGLAFELGLYNLVLVFDSNDWLERHSLVFIR